MTSIPYSRLPLAAALLLGAFAGPAAAQTVRTETVAQGLAHPWGLAFLPDGRMLVTERPGRLRVAGTDGKLSAPLGGVPAVVATGQGGLLDVALAPDFAASRLVYLTYSEAGEGGANGTAVARGKLSADAGRLDDVQVIYRQEPKKRSDKHFGSRLAFAPDGNLFVTLGERSTFKEEAQNPAAALGKVVRIKPDGGIPQDNPFVGEGGVRPEIWSLGHRNPQAAAIRPGSNALWVVEHGARGGDEVNVPLAGKNYGWPVISYGVDYSGARIGEGTQKAGLEQPLYYWDPSIAPSGMAFYTGDLFPAWKNSLFVGALKDRLLVRLSLDGDRVTGEERLLKDLGERIRDVRQGPDGALYLLTDSAQGRIIRLTPG